MSSSQIHQPCDRSNSANWLSHTLKPNVTTLSRPCTPTLPMPMARLVRVSRRS